MTLENLKTSISKLGKESLFEILHLIGSQLKDIYNCKMVRVNLEDLYEGMLVCQYVTGQNRPDPITKFISPEESLISQAFINNEVVLSWKLPGRFAKIQNPFEKLSKRHRNIGNNIMIFLYKNPQLIETLLELT